MSVLLNICSIDTLLFYVVAHAMFKGFLFMLSGIYLHLFNDLQDLRILSSLSKRLNIAVLFTVCCLWIVIGLPVMLGF